MRPIVPSKFFNGLSLPRLPVRPLLLGAAFTFLGVIVLASIALLQRAQGERERLIQTVETQSQIDELAGSLRRMESGQRGYLLTGDKDFIALYNETLPTVRLKLEAFESAVANHPSQKNRLDALKPLINAKLSEMAETISLYEMGKSGQAIKLVRTERGLRSMGEISELVRQIKIENATERFTQYADARRQERWLLVSNIIAVALIVMLAAASVLAVQKANSVMLTAQAVLRDANAELEANVAARTAELTAANEEIQKFAYIVSHDLRSPLVNIMGFTSELEQLKSELFGNRGADASALGNGADPAPRTSNGSMSAAQLEGDFSEALGFIKASITKMDRLINAILTISREGNRKLQAERIDMNELFTGITASAAHQSQEAEVSVELGALPTIVSDRLALEQIFSNLVDNALKYLRDDEKGRVQVKGANHGGKVKIEVKDNGRGIAPRDQERVFELFRRAGAQDKPGEGMGLAHVRALVRRLGGSISVESTPGQGSTFSVTLPRALPNHGTGISI